MTSNLQVTIKNTETELKSFPINQSLTLEFSEAVEDSLLGSYIYLVQALDSGSLIHIGDTYNQNVGLIKENFRPIDITFETVSVDPFQVKVKPLQPLTPGHTYQLLVQESIPSEYLSIVKSTSYSNSIIEVVKENGRLGNYVVNIETDSNFVNGKHMLSVSIDGVKQTFNLTDSSTIFLNGFTLKLPSQIYIKGESFTITAAAKTSKALTTFSVVLTAASTKDIKAIDDNYKSLTLDDIVNYNTQTETTLTTVDVSTLTYTTLATGYASFIVTFSQAIVPELDLATIGLRFREAFNMYTLGSLGLYDSTLNYTVEYVVLSDTEIEFYIKEDQPIV